MASKRLVGRLRRRLEMEDARAKTTLVDLDRGGPVQSAGGLLVDVAASYTRYESLATAVEQALAMAEAGEADRVVEAFLDDQCAEALGLR